MKGKKLISGGVTLAIFSLIAKGLGALYRIPLTNVLGAEGLGAYQMAYPVFALVIAATSSAIPVLVARTLPSIENGEVRISFFNSTLKYALIVGLAFGVVLAASGRLLAELQGSENAVYGYYVLSPAVVFVALLSAYRGWFNSRLETMVTSISGLIEQAVKAVGVLLAYIFPSENAGYSLALALSGVTLSEIVACLFAFFVYLKRNGLPRSPLKIPVKAVAMGMLPLTVGSLIFPLTTFVDSVMTARLLMFTGVEQKIAVAEYGILSGSVGTLVNLPVALSVSFAVTALPVIAEYKRKRDINGIKSNQTSSVKAVLTLSLPLSLGLVLAARPIVNVLYSKLSFSQRELAVLLLRFAAAEAPLAAMLQLFSAYLQAFDKSVKASSNMLVGALLKLVANFTALFLGVFGIVFATLLCYAVCLALDAYAVKKTAGKLKLDGLPRILFACATSGVVIYLIVMFIKNNILSTALAVLLGGLVYGIILLLFGAKRPEVKRG